MPYIDYRVDGEKVPSVTAIISRFKDSGGLLYWAHGQGMKGLPLYGEGSASRMACDVGACAHRMVEARIRGVVFDEAGYAIEILESARIAFEAFERWAKQCTLEPQATEISLLSKQYRYGGTLDSVTIDSDLRLLDWKTGGIYPDHLLQLGAYGQLWNENFPDRPITGYDLVSFSKSNGDFAHHSFQDLNLELKQFLLYRQAYDLDLQTKKRV